MPRRIKFRKQTTVPATLPADYIAYVLDADNDQVLQYASNEAGDAVYPVNNQGAVGPQGPQGDASTVPGPTGADGLAGLNGNTGAKGDTGASGENGTDGADYTTYTHIQTASATVWNITHGLTRYPVIVPVDDNGVVYNDAVIAYTSNTTATVTHLTAVTGKAYCS